MNMTKPNMLENLMMVITIMLLATLSSQAFAGGTPWYCKIIPWLPACFTAPPPPTPVPGTSLTRLYLQQTTDHSTIVKWRGEGDHDIRFGTQENDLNQSVEGNDLGGDDYDATLEGLNADTLYYYAVGNSREVYSFRTAPSPGDVPADGSVRVWIIGDSGTADDNARAVRDAYMDYEEGVSSTDVFLMLGDNAYDGGTDSEYQDAVFDIYTAFLPRITLWPTLGNHELGSGLSLGDKIGDAPYIDIFDLPTNGEAGGIPSGTEQYYSFDYGNVHFVCLDSQVTMRNPDNLNAMKSWLQDDLVSNSSDWTIVFFHHPPYSKGSHDSDKDSWFGMDKPMSDSREHLTPILEANSVDLVFTGHSHSYERSYYISGHTGKSDTFDAVIHGETDSIGSLIDGREEGDGAYTQITRSGIDDKVVYSVAGASGKVEEADLDHPAHFIGAAVLGSVVLDITSDRLDAVYIDERGVEIDRYTLTR